MAVTQDPVAVVTHLRVDIGTHLGVSPSVLVVFPPGEDVASPLLHTGNSWRELLLDLAVGVPVRSGRGHVRGCGSHSKTKRTSKRTGIVVDGEVVGGNADGGSGSTVSGAVSRSLFAPSDMVLTPFRRKCS